MSQDDFYSQFCEYLSGLSLPKETLNPSMFRYLYPFLTL